MHVSIHADSIVAETNRKHKICRFPAHTGKLQKLVHGSRNVAAIILQEIPTGLYEVLCLRVVKPYREN